MSGATMLSSGLGPLVNQATSSLPTAYAIAMYANSVRIERTVCPLTMSIRCHDDIGVFTAGRRREADKTEWRLVGAPDENNRIRSADEVWEGRGSHLDPAWVEVVGCTEKDA